MAGRTVEVVVTHHGECLGGVGPFEVDNPWWSEVEQVVVHLREVLGVPAVVLRLVDVAGGRWIREGHVTYHAEALARPAVTLPPAVLAGLDGPEPFRASWATPEGVRAALAWAERYAPGEPRQFKTWNLSALFRIGDAWLKLTPPFAAYEPAVAALLRSVDPTLAATVLAEDAGHRRMLMAHLPGRDCFDASPALIEATVTRWVAAQAALAEKLAPAPAGTALAETAPAAPAETGPPGTAPAAPPGTAPAAPAETAPAAPAGIPPRPTERLPADLRRLLDGEAGAQLGPGERDAEALAARLPGLVAELADCGLPASTLVHGDFHPGNWRAVGDDRATVIDLADAYLGHPVFDGERLRVFVGPERAAPVVDAWCAAWRRHRPAADPRRALRLARPLQELAGAVTYQMFLDNIEASERRYHAADPVAGIRDAIAACAELSD